MEIYDEVRIKCDKIPAIGISVLRYYPNREGVVLKKDDDYRGNKDRYITVYSEETKYAWTFYSEDLECMETGKQLKLFGE